MDTGAALVQEDTATQRSLCIQSSSSSALWVGGVLMGFVVITEAGLLECFNQLSLSEEPPSAQLDDI